MKAAKWWRWALIVMSSVAAAQTELPRPDIAPVESPFDLDAVAFASVDFTHSRLDVFVKVGYDRLSFVKQDEDYRASYEVTLSVNDSAGRLVQEKTWTQDVTVRTFNETLSSLAFSLTQRAFELSPGTYSVSANIRDIETKLDLRVVKKILISDFFTPGFSLSDIMLVSRIVTSGTKRTLTPHVSSNVGNLTEPFHLFLEAYNRPGVDSVRFVVNVLDEKNREQLSREDIRVLSPGRNQVFLTIDHLGFPLGEYRLFVRVLALHGTDTQSHLAATSRTINVRWRGLPKSIKDLDLAIEQLQYLAKEKDLAYIKEGATPEERQRRFIEFWKKKDPNPNTPRNEKMEEYYAKVEYANRNFRHHIEGWRTDMGMVYIIFGAPNSIDRHPFDMDAKPYEVWSYFDLNHRFVFVDQTGFGDYRLTTPIWQVWQRLKE